MTLIQGLTSVNKIYPMCQIVTQTNYDENTKKILPCQGNYIQWHFVQVLYLSHHTSQSPPAISSVGVN